MRTTTWAGSGFALVGVIHLLAAFGANVSVERGIELPVFGLSFDLIADVVLLVACVVLAFGAPGERAVVECLPARVGLILFGATGLPFVLPLPPALWAGWVIIGLDALTVLGGAVAAIAVSRGLRGWNRWSLAVLVAGEAVLLGVQIVLATVVLPLGAIVVLGWLPVAVEVLLIATGVGYLVAGRTAAIRSRTAEVRTQW